MKSSQHKSPDCNERLQKNSLYGISVFGAKLEAQLQPATGEGRDLAFRPVNEHEVTDPSSDTAGNQHVQSRDPSPGGGTMPAPGGEVPPPRR